MSESTLPRLTVLGTGYLGATHAICMAVLGFEVLGLDVDETKVARLAAGEVPFFEPGLPELLTKALESGRLRFTTSYEEAAAFGDVHFVCVGTPQAKGSHAADMTYVDAAVTSAATRAGTSSSTMALTPASWIASASASSRSAAASSRPCTR